MTVTPCSRVHFPHQGHELLTRVTVELTGGLVAEQQGWPADDRPCNGNSLLFAARELARAVVHPVRKADLAEERLGPSPAIIAVPVIAEWQHDILDRVEARQEI